MPQTPGIYQGHVFTPLEQDERKLIVDQRRLEVEGQAQKQRDELLARAEQIKNDNLLSYMFQNFRHHDGSPDYASITSHVAQVNPALGMELTDRVQKMQKQAIDMRKTELDTEKQSFEAGLQVLPQIVDQQTLETFLPKLQAVDPELAQAVGSTFDPERIQNIIERGMSEKDRLDRMKVYADLFAGDPAKALASHLSVARNQQDIDDAYAGAQAFLPANVLDGYRKTFGTVWGPGYAEHVGQMAMTPNERIDNATAQAQLDVSRGNLDVARGNLAVRRQELGATTGPQSAPTNPQGKPMPPEYQTAIARAMLTAPEAQRKAFNALTTRLWKEGNEKQLKEVIVQRAIEGENVDMKNLLRGRRATYASLNVAKEILLQMQQEGVPTGWFTGTAEDLFRKIGKTTNPKLASLKNRLEDVLITYRRAATGAQFGEKEAAIYEKMFPTYRNELPVNLALIDGLMSNMQVYDHAYWLDKLGQEGMETVGLQPGTSRSGSGGKKDPLGIR